MMKPLQIVPGIVAAGSLIVGMGVPAAAQTHPAGQTRPAGQQQSSAEAEPAADFASIEDFAALAELSAADEQALIDALESAPDEVVQSADPEDLHRYLTERVSPRAGSDDASTQAVPLVILAARAVACLAPAYTSLRAISTDSSPDVVAAGIASAVAGCVSGGGASVIKNAILKNKAVIAKGLRAIGLGGLAAALTGDTAQTAAAGARQHDGASVESALRDVRITAAA